MIEKLEQLEKTFDNTPNKLVLDGLMCIHLSLNIATVGDDELFKLLENGR